MYYHGFDDKNPPSDKYWTVYDDQLIGMLFSKIINKTVTVEAEQGVVTPQPDLLVDDMVNNLFDLCLYISKDCPQC